jgi:hypothetical protein
VQPTTSELAARIEQLENAIRTHRFDIGEGYHYHSFRTVHRANQTLWATLGTIPNQPTPPSTEPSTEQSLHRPAMMEDTE